MTQVQEFLDEMLPAQRAAEQAMHDGDVEPRLALWSREDPVTLFGAVLAASGWADVEPAFRTVAGWFSGSADYEFEVVAAGVSGDLAYTISYERNRTVMNGEETVYTLRATHVYRREGGRWRIVHRHADAEPAGSARLGSAPG